MSYWEPTPEPTGVVITNPDRSGRGSPRHRQINQEIARRIVLGSGGNGMVPGRQSTRTVGGINPSTDNRFTALQRTGSKSKTGTGGRRLPGQGIHSAGGFGLPYDAEAAEAIKYIQDSLANDFAEYEQQRQVADVEAERRRIPIRRDMDIQNRYGPLAQQGVNQETAELMDALNRVVPLTQQIYDEGVSSVGDAYNSGAAMLANQIAGSSDLSRQLEALSGSAGTLEQDMEGTTAFIQNLLNASGAAGAASLAKTGSGEMEAIRNSLGGYNTEAEKINSDIGLSVAAALQGLRQDLALVQPEFIPFNYGELMLDAQHNISNAIRDSADRAEAERRENEDAKRQRYTGLEGMNYFATQRGRPDLALALQDIIDASLMEGTGEAGIAQAISGYGREGQLARQQVQALIDQDADESEIEALANQLGLDYEEEFKPTGGTPFRFKSTDFGLGVSLPGWQTGTPNRRPIRINRMSPEEAAQQRQDMDLLRTLYSIYTGNYSSYE